jgi:hypothetical protein
MRQRPTARGAIAGDDTIEPGWITTAPTYFVTTVPRLFFGTTTAGIAGVDDLS